MTQANKKVIERATELRAAHVQEMRQRIHDIIEFEAIPEGKKLQEIIKSSGITTATIVEYLNNILQADIEEGLKRELVTVEQFNQCLEAGYFTPPLDSYVPIIFDRIISCGQGLVIKISELNSKIYRELANEKSKVNIIIRTGFVEYDQSKTLAPFLNAAMELSGHDHIAMARAVNTIPEVIQGMANDKIFPSAALQARIIDYALAAVKNKLPLQESELALLRKAMEVSLKFVANNRAKLAMQRFKEAELKLSQAFSDITQDTPFVDIVSGLVTNKFGRIGFSSILGLAAMTRNQQSGLGKVIRRDQKRKNTLKAPMLDRATWNKASEDEYRKLIESLVTKEDGKVCAWAESVLNRLVGFTYERKPLAEMIALATQRGIQGYDKFLEFLCKEWKLSLTHTCERLGINARSIYAVKDKPRSDVIYQMLAKAGIKKEEKQTVLNLWKIIRGEKFLAELGIIAAADQLLDYNYDEDFDPAKLENNPIYKRLKLYQQHYAADFAKAGVILIDAQGKPNLSRVPNIVLDLYMDKYGLSEKFMHEQVGKATKAQLRHARVGLHELFTFAEMPYATNVDGAKLFAQALTATNEDAEKLGIRLIGLSKKKTFSELLNEVEKGKITIGHAVWRWRVQNLTLRADAVRMIFTMNSKTQNFAVAYSRIETDAATYSALEVARAVANFWFGSAPKGANIKLRETMISALCGTLLIQTNKTTEEMFSDYIGQCYEGKQQFQLAKVIEMMMQIKGFTEDEVNVFAKAIKVSDRTLYGWRKEHYRLTFSHAENLASHTGFVSEETKTKLKVLCMGLKQQDCTNQVNQFSATLSAEDRSCILKELVQKSGYGKSTIGVMLRLKPMQWIALLEKGEMTICKRWMEQVDMPATKALIKNFVNIIVTHACPNRDQVKDKLQAELTALAEVRIPKAKILQERGFNKFVDPAKRRSPQVQAGSVRS